jgi:hypothetical protein
LSPLAVAATVTTPTPSTQANNDATKAKINADYDSAKLACDRITGTPNRVCMAEAKGQRNNAKAEWKASAEPTTKTRYHVLETKADSAYDIAKARCQAQTGNAKDVCVKEAKAAKVAAVADAKVQMKSSNANQEAKTEVKDAKQDAKIDKNDANYTVAREKCDALTGTAKTRCQDDAKIKFGKS